MSDPSYIDTADMTYQEKIEALSGTIYDYDDYCDSRPHYFDYDEPELYGFDSPAEGGMYYDYYESDASGNETILSQSLFGDRSAGVVSALEPEDTGMETDRCHPNLIHGSDRLTLDQFLC